MDQLPRLGKRELICLLLINCNYMVSIWRGFLFFWVLGLGYVILLWHSLSLPYNYFGVHANLIDVFWKKGLTNVLLCISNTVGIAFYFNIKPIDYLGLGK